MADLTILSYLYPHYPFLFVPSLSFLTTRYVANSNTMSVTRVIAKPTLKLGNKTCYKNLKRILAIRIGSLKGKLLYSLFCLTKVCNCYLPL